MKKTFALIMAFMAVVATIYAGDKYAQSNITWSVGPWYDAATGGNVVSIPGSGDNVFTQGNDLTISADATCDNITLTRADNQLSMGAGVTLTVRGKIKSTVYCSGVNYFSGANANSTLKLTGEVAPQIGTSGIYLLVSDSATRAIKPGNIIVETADSRQYQWAENSAALSPNTGDNNFTLGGAGKITIKTGTQLTAKCQIVVGQATTNELIVEEGATLSVIYVRGSFSNSNYPATKATINGTVIHNSINGFSIKDIVIGANGRLVTNAGNKTTTYEKPWDGWWASVNVSNPVLSGQYATPASMTLASGSTIEFSRTDAQNLNGLIPANQYLQGSSVTYPGSPSTPSYAINYSNIVLSGSGSTKTIQSNLTFTGTLTVNSGVTLSIPVGVTLTVAAGGKITNAGTITNNGTINFMSDANNGAATVLNTGTIGGSGTINVNQYLTAGRNWYIANPVAAVSPTVVSGTIALNGYDEQTVVNGAGTWALTTNPLVVGKGYVATVSADGNVTFTGTLNNGNQNIALSSRTGTANKAGFNLIGNPYPSYLDWSLVTANSANSALLRSNTLWYRTKKLNQLSQLVYQLQTVNGDGVSVPNDGNAIIPPMQSFWVRAVASVASPIVVTNAMRAHAPASDKLLKAPTAKKAERTLVRLQVSNGVNTDETLIYYSVNASNDQDSYDAPKMFENKVEVPEIFTTAAGSERMVINAMNSIQLDSPIGLGFLPGNATSFSIKATEITNLPEGVKLILKDNITLSKTDLTDGSASYTFGNETTNADRFSLIFSSAGAITHVENTLSKTIKAYYNNSQLVVNCDDDQLIGSTLSIYNAMGQLVNVKRLTNSKMQIGGSFVAGVYMLKINNNTAKVVVN